MYILFFELLITVVGFPSYIVNMFHIPLVKKEAISANGLEE